jgi:site-specific DNA-methyltransferase (adenine-specific)
MSRIEQIENESKPCGAFVSANMTWRILLGDCIEHMQQLQPGSVDLVLTDPPYGTTACKWDAVIPFEPMWREVRRVLKPNGAAIFTAAQPFTSALVMSNAAGFAHSWIWDKGVGSNFTQAKRVPLKVHEDVLVFTFGDTQPRYFPIMAPRGKPMKMGGNSGKRGTGAYDLRGPAVEAKEASGKVYTEAFPKSVLAISPRSDPERGLHPTQKPVALMEYLIRTYSHEGETVLDFTMGSGTTGVACINTGRRFIGIERDEGYFRKAQERLVAAITERSADLFTRRA